MAASAAAAKVLRTHLVFGANTDVGKTVVTAGLVRARLAASAAATESLSSPSSSSPPQQSDAVHYIKPLQCGGSDEAWVRRHVELPFSSSAPLVSSAVTYSARTLYRWEMATSPHLASRVERMPVSDDEVLASLSKTLSSLGKESSTAVNMLPSILLETAGGVLSPSSASPENVLSRHSRDPTATAAANDNPLSWGWSTQADLYQPLGLPVILVGDGRLGGISCTLSALESLQIRGYDVHGIVVIDDGGGYGNVTALREYASRSAGGSEMQQQLAFHDDPSESIVSLPPLPPEPVPLDEWYQSLAVEEKLSSFETRLEKLWKKEEYDESL